LRVGGEAPQSLGQVGPADDEPLGPRGEESAKSSSGLAGSPVESSIEMPAMPLVTARRTLAPTCDGSIANPPSKSALIGISTLAAISSKCRSASSIEIALSACPRDQAKPELVVASARNPSPSR